MSKKSKTFVVKGLLLTILATLLSCVVDNQNQPERGEYGDKILIVRIERGSDFPSDTTTIRNAFVVGGQITLGVEVLRELDRRFDDRFTASSYDRRFLTRPAILNFVGGQGWRLLQVNGNEYIFVRSRDSNVSVFNRPE